MSCLTETIIVHFESKDRLNQVIDLLKYDGRLEYFDVAGHAVVVRGQLNNVLDFIKSRVRLFESAYIIQINEGYIWGYGTDEYLGNFCTSSDVDEEPITVTEIPRSKKV